jgi:hypothetical protein
MNAMRISLGSPHCAGSVSAALGATSSRMNAALVAALEAALCWYVRRFERQISNPERLADIGVSIAAERGMRCEYLL